ncbi:MAG: hypothetical protein EOO65_04510, partial [Methanosarcinales archaeon]
MPVPPVQREHRLPRMCMNAPTLLRRVQVDDYILRKTTGSITRVRPVTREELELEIQRLNRQLTTAHTT